MNSCDVLIVGAGPTGLVIALWLAKLGVRVRIVDKAPEAGTTSRAIGVAARTLELYRQVDLARDLVDHGLPLAAMNLWVKGKHAGRAEFGRAGEGLSPFPYVLSYPQDAHEKLLIEKLAAIGVAVERPVELLDCHERPEGVSAQLRRKDGSVETVEATYVAGCDGARSRVREVLQIGYLGGTYSHLFYVADVEASGPQMNREAHVGLGERGDFIACFALDDRSHARLVGTVRQDAIAKGAELGWNDVSQQVIERMGLVVQRVNWFSTYHVHHRVASAFRVGRVFLAGDAAHIHSPVGGQGMNTGIGDAINLAWKLAAVLQGHAEASIIDSYEQERIPFAQALVRTTDKVFELVVADGPLAKRMRLDVVPQILPRLFHSARFRRFLFKTVSQIKVSYRRSALSEGRAGAVCGGDRLPWVELDGGADNFSPLSSVSWQAHVYGESDPALRDACEQRHLAFIPFRWSNRAEAAGLARDALYLVRPDGYVALAAPRHAAQERLVRYLDARKLRLPVARSLH